MHSMLRAEYSSTTVLNALRSCDHGMKQQAHAGLAEAVLKARIEKNQTLRTGNWEMWPLDAAQQHYAALDAYASLLLYKASTPIQVDRLSLSRLLLCA